jgi:hypothetical protein
MERSTTLDQELLARARAAGDRLRAAERELSLARAESHTAIRRLHLAGGPLREIAQVLGLSHQRVQQIVERAGGSWWQRVWRSRRIPRDAVCTFCASPPSEVAKLIAGPDVYVCDGCVAAAERALAGRPSTLAVTRQGRRPACSFCAKAPAAGRPVVAAAAASVCGDCLRTCREILDSRS